MAKGGEIDRDGILGQEARKVEELRAATIRQNNEMLISRGLPPCAGIANGLPKSIQQQKRRKKNPSEVCNAEQNGQRVLRSQSARVGLEKDQPTHDGDVEDILNDSSGELEGSKFDDGQQNKKGGRKTTRMLKIHDRRNQPRIRVECNKEGQPIGDKATEFSNFLSTLVKRDIRLRHNDWRSVDFDKRMSVWENIKKFYDVDDKLKDWVIGSVAKKWRDFKANFKNLHYDESKTKEELLEARDERVSQEDWAWLVQYWFTEEAKKRSQQGKQNREKLTVLHTAGSKSYARVRNELQKVNGFAIRRDELFIATHMRKNGAPSSKAEEIIMKELEDTTNDHPELLEKTIKQGDLLSHVLGKERNGYVRCVSLGPSATDLHMKGYTRLPSTKLQMAEKEAKEALQENAQLRERIDQIENDTNTKVAALMEEMQQMRRLIAANGRENVEINSPSDSNSPIHKNMRVDIENSVQESIAAENLDVQALLAVHKEATVLMEEEEAIALTQKKEAPALAQKKEAAVLAHKKEAVALMKKKEEEALMQTKKEATSVLQKKKEAAVTQKIPRVAEIWSSVPQP